MVCWGRWEVVGGSLVVAQGPNGDLGELRCADGQGISSRELPRTRVARVCWDVELATGWPSGQEWNGSQAGEGVTELGIPGPALGEMQSEVACRAGDPSHQSEGPPPEGLGGHGRFGQTNPRRPAGQVVRHHLYRQPGSVGGEAAERHVARPGASPRSRRRSTSWGRPRRSAKVAGRSRPALATKRW